MLFYLIAAFIFILVLAALMLTYLAGGFAPKTPLEKLHIAEEELAAARGRRAEIKEICLRKNKIYQCQEDELIVLGSKIAKLEKRCENLRSLIDA